MERSYLKLSPLMLVLHATLRILSDRTSELGAINFYVHFITLEGRKVFVKGILHGPNQAFARSVRLSVQFQHQ